MSRFAKTLFSNSLSKHTVDWVNRVLKNGGSKPSYNTIISIDEFIKTLGNNGLLNKMKSVCMFAPDNLVAAICPIYKTYGYDIWTNYNFVSGDLNVNGLKGNASNKYLNTGITPNTAMSTTSNGATLYASEPINEAAFDMGGFDGSYYYEMAVGWNDTPPYTSPLICDYSYISDQVAYDRIEPTSDGMGYVSGNRIGSTLKLFRGKSTKPHGVGVYSGNTSSGGITSAAIAVFASTNRGFYSSKRFSFCGIHDGLTEGESLILYNSITLCRQRLGGGVI